MISKMSLRSRRVLIKNMQENYQRAQWREKSKILDSFIAATGYQRKYAISVLNSRKSIQQMKVTRVRPVLYNEAVRKALIVLWNAANKICSKRLVPFLPELISVLERYGHLCLSSDTRNRLLRISISTADRILKRERLQQGKGLSTTKPGGLLKKQIQIRTFADWNDINPGFLECDLVAHCGGTAYGSFLNTLVLTDIASGWTECLPLLRKSSTSVISGITVTQQLLPFKLLGIDTDNGSEFINYELLQFCKSEEITFTRSRAYKKNDQAHVEEKNGSIVRRLIGYNRYEGTDAWHALADLYVVLRLYVNYFQPSLKLSSKKRDGARVTKKYDTAKTPCQRLLNSEILPLENKEKLKLEYESLDPIKLLQQLKKCQEKLFQYAWSKPAIRGVECPSISEESCLQQRSPSNDESNDHESISIKKYLHTKKPRKPVTWRTRRDPFEHVWEDLCLRLELNPRCTAKSLLDELIQLHPEEFNYRSLRTLQRRVANWRTVRSSIRTAIFYDKSVSNSELNKNTLKEGPQMS